MILICKLYNRKVSSGSNRWTYILIFPLLLLLSFKQQCTPSARRDRRLLEDFQVGSWLGVWGMEPVLKVTMLTAGRRSVSETIAFRVQCVSMSRPHASYLYQVRCVGEWELWAANESVMFTGINVTFNFIRSAQCTRIFHFGWSNSW